MSQTITLALPAGIEQLTIDVTGDLALHGSERSDLLVDYDGDETPVLEQTAGGTLLQLEGDADIQLPAGLNLVVVRAADLAAERLQGQVIVAKVRGDASLTGCRHIELETVAGDLSATGCATLQAGRVQGDTAVTNGAETSLGQVKGDLSLTRGGRVTLESVGGDLACSDIAGPLQIGSVQGDMTTSALQGDLIVQEAVRGDVVLRSRVQAGQRIHLRTWGTATVLLNGPLNLHSLSGQGRWDTLPDWDQLRSQAPNPQQEGGAEVLVAAGERLVAASYEFNMGDLTETLNKLGEQLSSLGTHIAEQVRSGMAVADFEGLSQHLREAMADVDWRSLKKDLRAAERAKQRAERMARRAAKQARYGASVHVDIVQPTAQPATTAAPAAVVDTPQASDRPAAPGGGSERLMILKMIQEGKITPEQGERLLDALPG